MTEDQIMGTKIKDTELTVLRDMAIYRQVIRDLVKIYLEYADNTGLNSMTLATHDAIIANAQQLTKTD